MSDDTLPLPEPERKNVLPDAALENSEDLSPCPFCGSEQVYIATRRTTNMNTHIFCAHCSMSFRGENWNQRAQTGLVTTRKQRIRNKLAEGLLLLPTHMRGGITRYVENGIVPGSFLRQLIQGRTREAFTLADPVNMTHEDSWLLFLSDYMPPECHGDPDKFVSWVEHQGLSGLADGQ